MTPTPELERLLNALDECVLVNIYEHGYIDRAAAAKILEPLVEDKERLDWLEQEGQGSALVSDDHSRWSVATSGIQNCPDDEPTDIQTTFFIEKAEWKPDTRAAIDARRTQQSTKE